MLLLNLPWLALPIGTIIRMAREHPFTELVPPAPTFTELVPPAPAGT